MPATTSNLPNRYQFGDLTLEAGPRRVKRGQDSLDVGGLTFDLLQALVESAPNVIGHDELVNKVWLGRPTSPETITQRAMMLRHALSDDAERPRYFEAVRGHGYRLIPEVSSLPANATAGSPQRPRAAFAALVLAGLATILAIGWQFLEPQRSELDVAPIIAVLPFANLSGDEGDDYLGESIAEEIIHALSNGSGLRVIARTSSFSFQGTSADSREISERLGASVILEGSVRRENGRLRVMVQLVESESSTHLWSAAFDEPTDDLLAVEQEIALAVAQRLMGDEADMARIAAALSPVEDISAYEYYLLGRQRMQNPSGREEKRSISETNRAIEYFRRAVEVDPEFARAYAGLADALLLRSTIGTHFGITGDSAETVKEEVLAAIDQALRLEPQLAEAHLSRGIAIAQLDHDRERARAAFRQAIILNPNLAAAHYYLSKGPNRDEAILALEKALQLDPMSSEAHVWMGRQLGELGRVTEAETYFVRAQSLERRAVIMFFRPARNKESLGRPDEAIRLLQPLVGDPEFEDNQSAIQSEIATYYMDLNDYEQAEALLRPLADSPSCPIRFAFALGRCETAPDLARYLDSPVAPGDAGLVALYDLTNGNNDSARARYEKLASSKDLTSMYWRLGSGYYPAVSAAHLYLKAGDTETAEPMLRDARRALNLALEDRYTAGAAYYLLASIDAIEGNIDEALAMFEQAIASGWIRHWYALRDPNLESLWADPRFQALITDLRSEMDRLRAAM